MKPSNLWANYLMLFNSRKEAMTAINAACDTSYNPNRIGEFIRGIRPTPEHIKIYMRYCTAKQTLEKYLKIKVSQETAYNIADELT